jgi:hypothetical protein
MKPAGGYYLLYLTRPTDKRDRPTGYLFNHFFSFLCRVCVCVSGVSVFGTLVGRSRKSDNKNKQDKKECQIFIFVFLFLFSFFLVLENHGNTKQKYGKWFFPFSFFYVCVFLGLSGSWLPLARSSNTHTHRPERNTPNRFSDNVISS